jgi:sec-independent protein translocase protein TatA
LVIQQLTVWPANRLKEIHSKGESDSFQPLAGGRRAGPLCSHLGSAGGDMRLGVPELLIIFAVLLLLFGASRLPALGSSLGSAIKNFKRGFSDEMAPDDAPTADPKSPGTLPGQASVKGSVGSKASSKES